MQEFTISDASAEDASDLVALRITAMRPSLEAVGRFDPDRARRRFLDSFEPRDTRLIHIGDDLAGFFVLRTHADHLHLDHIYISPAHQGGGIGRQLIRFIQEEARAQALPIRLMALHGSKANDFYLSCWFVLDRVGAFDNHYTWAAA